MLSFLWQCFAILNERRPPTRNGEREEETHDEVILLVACRISSKFSRLREEAPLEETGAAAGALRLALLVVMPGETEAVSGPQEGICHHPGSVGRSGEAGGRDPSQGVSRHPVPFLICRLEASC